MSNPDLIFPTGGDWVEPGMPYDVYRRSGHSFAIRYVVPSIPGKFITRNEINAAHHSSVDVAFVYETTGTTWRGGGSQGRIDGENARIALQSLGAPESVACYHAVDSSASDNELLLVWSWFSQVIEAMKPYRAGIYGEYSVIEMAYAHNPRAYRWQTQAWSGGKVSHHADILQLGQQNVAGINFDVDLAYVDDFGQWYANPARQPQQWKEEDMPQGFIAPSEKIGHPLPSTAYTTLALYCDTGLFDNQPQRIRVACYSAAKKYSQIEEVILTSADPHLIHFSERDVTALSFSRGTSDGAGAIGWTVA